MKSLKALISVTVLCLGQAGGALAADCWSDYLDYAYVYSSAEPRELRERLDGYAAKCGMSLGDHISEKIEVQAARNPRLGEDAQRRRAVAHLLQYLSTDDPRELSMSVAAVRKIGKRLARRENRYWHHYILAHRALEARSARSFTREVFGLWTDVAAELEAPYATLDALSLSDPASAGFLSALPYIYENVARLVVIRSQQKGLDHGFDALGAIVRLLGDGRVGGQPDVIPVSVSSREYLDAVIARLNGPESNGGSLTFTLALFEASKRHDEARDLLARDGFSSEALQAIRVATGGYERALSRADTLQGQCAVYTRALRQLGELYTARQRLGETPDVDIPFSIDQAMDLYADMHKDMEDAWERHGFRDHGREAYLNAMLDLWQEIQEASLNAAATYRSLGRGEGPRFAENRRQASGFYARYLSFFDAYATSAPEGIPDSAYFAAYEAAKGIGDTVIYGDAAAPSAGELELAATQYQNAISFYPFDRRARASLADVLERQGRDTEFLELVKPQSWRVERSLAVEAWIRNGEKSAEHIANLRQALSNDQVLMHFGFSDVDEIDGLEHKLVALREERREIVSERETLEGKRSEMTQKRSRGLVASVDEGASGLPSVSAAGPRSEVSIEISRLDEQITDLSARSVRLAEKIEARERALPIFQRALAADFLARKLSGERDNPLHVLLRRIHSEGDAPGERG